MFNIWLEFHMYFFGEKPQVQIYIRWEMLAKVVLVLFNFHSFF